MKIAIRGGHNFQARGAKALIDETTEDRKVKDYTIKYLKSLGHNVIDVTPGNCDTNTDLKFGVNKANKEGVDLFLSIHFNKAYDSYNGAIGTECWTIGPNKATTIAEKITNNIASLGFKNRGVKHSKGLYELKHTNMPAIIIEVCFVEATKDVELYSKVGSEEIGKKIAEAVGDKKIDSNNIIYRVKLDGVQIGAYSKEDNVIKEIKNSWGKFNKIEIERK